MTVTGVFNFENDTPVENWLLNSVDGLTGCTITLPTDWVQVMQLTNTEAWPLLFSLSTERIEKERLNIPVAAFRFWEQKEFKELLHETTDKSALYKFKPEEEKMQGIVYLLIEMFKIRRCIKMLNMYPEIAKEFFSQKWAKLITGYQIIKS